MLKIKFKKTRLNQPPCRNIHYNVYTGAPHLEFLDPSWLKNRVNDDDDNDDDDDDGIDDAL